MINKESTLFERYKEDFAYCEQIIKKHSKSFYSAFSQLPQKKHVPCLPSMPFVGKQMMPSIVIKTSLN